jgi:hypothetical protein
MKPLKTLKNMRPAKSAKNCKNGGLQISSQVPLTTQPPFPPFAGR